jgi:pimeloyl-ACP methyl ester carboxylesterase
MGAGSSRRRPRRAVVVSLIATVVVASGFLVSCTSTAGSKGTVTGTWGTTASTPPASTPGASEPAATPIVWSSCSGGDCGRLTVPLDGTGTGTGTAAAGTAGKTIELALFRVPARDPDKRIGSLLVNPGGPGASGIDLAKESSRFLPADVSDRFDVIGWDPRGVGASTSIDCGDRLDYLFSGDTSPNDTAEWSALDAVSRRFADACGTRTGAQLLENISTLATVHDMERIRLALGEDQITYLGFSYGTELGSMYATLYPGRVRAMVLDGAVDASLSAMESATQQAEGLEQGLDQFFANCSHDDSCPIHDDPPGVYNDVTASIEAAPMRVHDNGEDRLLTPAESDVAVAAALYSQSSWSDLARALASAQQGNGSGMLDLFDSYMRRDRDGKYADEWPAFLAITCLDGPSLGGPDVYPAAEAAAALRAPRFGAANVGLGLPCAYWSVPTAAPLPSVSAPTAAPIVVIGTRYDPITPIEWSQALVAQLGGQAHLVVTEGQGHTSFGSGNQCLDTRITDYLVHLAVPPADLDCGT